MADFAQELSTVVREAAANGTPLRIAGGGTKDFYGSALRGEMIATGAYRGIIAYDPTELVITARAGTPLVDIEAALLEKRQMLAFEPPYFGPGATLGGCIAAGLSGPGRAYRGAVRDFVLGVRVLDGRGSDLRFGGQVMKNVAGYDVSRLMAGSLGTLSVILEASLKVLPLPPGEATLHLECTESDVLRSINEWAGKALPMSATAYRDGELRVRLSGASAAVESAASKLGGTRVDPAQAARFWQGIRDHTDPWFADTRPLWRLSVAATAAPLDIPGEQLIEWGGALRWVKTDADPSAVRAAAARAGGHATLFRGGDRSGGAFHPLSPALMQIHRRLKQSFDPAGILNPGRMYPDW
jgi:glycolate oxidase FAD binding subunit